MLTLCITGIQGFVPQGYGVADKEIQSSRSEIKSKVTSHEEEEDDPLDAFMLDIDNQVQKESLNKPQQEKVYTYSYFFFKKKKLFTKLLKFFGPSFV